MVGFFRRLISRLLSPRGTRVERLSLLIILLCLALTALLPQMREMLRVLVWLPGHPFRLIPTHKEIEKAAARYPDDVMMQIAAAEDWLDDDQWMNNLRLNGPDDFYVSYRVRVSRLAQIVNRHPESASARLRLTMMLMDQAWQMGPGHPWESDPKRIRQLNTEQIAIFKQAIEHLNIATTLDPDNAVPVYLLAMTHFALGDDTTGDELLKKAVTRNDLRFYSQQLAYTNFRLYREAGSPAFSTSLGIVCYPTNRASLDDMCSYLYTKAAKASRKNAHAQAVLYFEAVIQFSRAKLNQTGHMESWTPYAVATQFIDGKKIKAIVSNQKLIAKGLAEGSIDRVYHEAVLRQAAYLTTHGRPDLAREGVALLDLARRVDNASTPSAKSFCTGFTSTYSTPTLGNALLALVQSISLAALIGIAALILRFSSGWRIRNVQGWRWWEYPILMFFLLIPTHISALYYPPIRCEFTTLRCNFLNDFTIQDDFTRPMKIAVLALVFVIIPAFIGAIVGRSDHRSRLRPLHRGASGLYTLLLPSLAVSLVFVLGFCLTAQAHYKRWETQISKLAQQGQIQYFKIPVPEGVEAVEVQVH